MFFSVIVLTMFSNAYYHLQGNWRKTQNKPHCCCHCYCLLLLPQQLIHKHTCLGMLFALAHMSVPSPGLNYTHTLIHRQWCWVMRSPDLGGTWSLSNREAAGSLSSGLKDRQHCRRRGCSALHSSPRNPPPLEVLIKLFWLHIHPHMQQPPPPPRPSACYRCCCFSVTCHDTTVLLMLPFWLMKQTFSLWDTANHSYFTK